MSTCQGAPAPHENCPRGTACDWQTPTGVPPDVLVWLANTYTEQGIEIWCKSYRNGDAEHKAKLIRLARTPDGGT